MLGFIGGSAPAMAAQICEGYILLNKNTLRGWPPSDLQALRAEVDKLLREVRASVPPQDDALQNQARNRKIGRLSAAMQIVQGALTGRPPA
jgi:hypothetical protein